MKAFSCRLKSIPVPEATEKKFLIPARYSSIEFYQQSYKTPRETPRETSPETSPEKTSVTTTPPPKPTPNPYTRETLSRSFPHIDFRKPWVVELGTGTGEFVTDAAKKHPDKLFIGVDAAMPCIERALCQLPLQDAPTNLLFYQGLALDFLQADFNGLLFHEILVNFPDPWPKKRHIKRRLVSPLFIDAAVKALAPTGVLITATDVEALWDYHLEVISAYPPLKEVDLKSLPSHTYYSFFSRYREKNLANTQKVYFTAHRVLPE